MLLILTLAGVGFGLLMIGGPILLDGLFYFCDWFAALPTWSEGIFIICMSLIGYFLSVAVMIVCGKW